MRREDVPSRCTDKQKITANNTWNFALIDYFADMTLLRNGPDDQSMPTIASNGLSRSLLAIKLTE